MISGTGMKAWVLGLVLGTIALAMQASGAAAQEPPIALDLIPSGYDGAYFSLDMQPGETRDLAVEMSNHGSALVSARVYSADVYSLINGGFGALLDGEPTSGTTTWLAFESATVDLEAGEALVRTFTVSVPDDAAPGDHITSLIVQNAEPVAAGNSGVAFNQIQRKAVAVNITVPGLRTPGLSVGAVSHKAAAETSFVAFEVTNTGNVHLRPGGSFILMDADGAELTRFPVALDSVYAGMSTLVEVPFDRILPPGSYTAQLDLSFEGGTATSGAAALEIVVEADQPSVSGGESNDGRATIRGALQLPASDDGLALPAAAIVVLMIAALAGTLTVAARKSLRQHAGDGTAPFHAASTHGPVGASRVPTAATVSGEEGATGSSAPLRPLGRFRRQRRARD